MQKLQSTKSDAVKASPMRKNPGHGIRRQCDGHAEAAAELHISCWTLCSLHSTCPPHATGREAESSAARAIVAFHLPVPRGPWLSLALPCRVTSGERRGCVVKHETSYVTCERRARMCNSNSEPGKDISANQLPIDHVANRQISVDFWSCRRKEEEEEGRLPGAVELLGFRVPGF